MIADKANEDVRTLAKKYFPKGEERGDHYFAANVDDNPTSKKGGLSLQVNLTGNLRGCWTDHALPSGAPGRSGDMIDLIAIRDFGGDHREAKAKAFAWAKSHYGLDTLDPARIEKEKRDIAVRAEAHDAEAAEREEKRRKRVWSLWSSAVPIAGTPALDYLTGRGIDFHAMGRVSGALRYRPDVWCDERGGKFPAMIACVMALNDPRPIAVHRTYLDISDWSHRTRSGPVRKAAIGVAKKVVGGFAGGCIPLWKGACQRTLRDITPGTPIYISEGIEDGLSIATAMPTARVVAAVALANMGGLVTPPQSGPLIFVGQNDGAGSKAEASFASCIARQQAAGRRVELIFPPPAFKDFNDQLCGKPMA